MKIAIITDTHFGVRSDNQILLKHYSDFFKNQFFPYLKKHKIKVVYHLGDLVDRRKYINFVTLNEMKRCFLEPLKDYEVHMIVGNHDVYNKNTNDLNALDELLNQKNIKVYTKPVEVHGNLLVPWICPDNFEESIEAIRQSKAKSCFGHFEISGFEMARGINCEHGLSTKIFKNFDLVASGHFHNRSSNENIQYVGAPYEMNWSDHDMLKGFSVFDTETNQLEFIQNKKTIFEKIEFNKDSVADNYSVKNKYVRVLVREKNDVNLEKFIDLLEKQEPFDLKVIEVVSLDTTDTDIDQAEDTTTILSKYIDSLNIDLDKNRLKTMFFELYKEAISLKLDV